MERIVVEALMRWTWQCTSNSTACPSMHGSMITYGSKFTQFYSDIVRFHVAVCQYGSCLFTVSVAFITAHAIVQSYKVGVIFD